MNPTLRDLQDDLKAAEQEVLKYEKKYGVPSKSFHDCFLAGLIEDCGNFDLLKWAGYFESKRDLEQLSVQLNLTES